jgi:methionyl-tRNA formyltransferase
MIAPMGVYLVKHLIVNCKKNNLYAKGRLPIGPETETIFFVHWHWKIPPEIHGKYNCIGFHATDLPFGRGGSPIKNLLKLGYKKTKITAFRIVEEMDAGPIYLKKTLSLKGTEDYR